MAERLIDVEALKHKRVIATYGNLLTETLTEVEVVYVEDIDNAPTIEAKPVVYCKDCKYNVANSKHEPLDITDYTDITCEYFMTDGMSPNDFCSQGVKIPVISMEDVPKIMEELPSVEENPILKAVEAIKGE